MKHIEIHGLGVHIEVYKRRDEMTDLEVLKEAEKAIRREVLKYEQRTRSSIPRSDNYNDI